MRARRAMHKQVRQWVIRHERERRRAYHPGEAIRDGGTPTRGLDIPSTAALPFLLAARAHAIAHEAERGMARPLFAYGIASSYDAFLRLGSGESRDTDSVDSPASVDEAVTAAVDWYRGQIDTLLSDESVRSRHPKVEATIDRAFDLWRRGEKCLVFCWYIRTGAAVEHALSERIDEWIAQEANRAFGLTEPAEVSAKLKSLSESVLRSDSLAYRRIREQLSGALHVEGISSDRHEVLVDIAIRNLRSPTSLARYAGLSNKLDADVLWKGINGDNHSGANLLQRWKGYASRVAVMTHSEWERVELALTGESDSTTQSPGGRRSGASLETVRRAYGQTDRGTRERLTAAFNTPFAPDVLVASSVMGEGIDLHQECRFVIHHDLDWNPSILEQRTGRLDRIGALAERAGCNIEVFEPYLAGTHDEKMYRVVKDRAGWFDVVMGRAVRTDEDVTDAEERRVNLHESIRQALTMDLASR